MNPRPARVVHKGVVRAAAYLIDARTLGEGHARNVILTHWRAGCTVQRIEDRALYVLKLPEIERTRCDAAPGRALTLEGDVYFALPLSRYERQQLPEPVGQSIVLCEHSRIVVIPPTDCMRIDPSLWIVLPEFEWIEPKPLGAPPARPRVLAESLNEDARSSFAGHVPEAAEKMEEVIAALRGGKPSGSDRGGWNLKPALQWLGRVFRPRKTSTEDKQASASQQHTQGATRPSLLGWLLGLFAAGAAQAGNAGGAGAQAPSRPTPKPRRHPLRGLLNQFMMRTRLFHLAGMRQARYLARMMAMFEQGDIENALRHAIPLRRLGDDTPTDPSFGLPTPRSELRISLDPPQPSSSGINLGEDFYERLRKMYRSKFERLDAQGEIEKAAFVLAELLDVPYEAVDYLERHEQYKLAARIAESRELKPELVVRLWFLARNPERAVLIARRTGAFAQAVQELEKRQAPEAQTLRVLWAKTLAESGNYQEAVKVIWPVIEGRRLALRWMDLVIEAGGPAAAAMLARKAAIVPEAFEPIRDTVHRLLCDPAAQTLGARLAFIETLLEQEPREQLRVLAREAARTYLRDISTLNVERKHHDQRLSRLIEFSRDAALRTDRPVITQRPLVPEPQDLPIDLRWPAEPQGVTAPKDIRCLSDGTVLIALGEGGVKMIKRNGKTVAHFAVPAYHLVLADHDHHAIALAPREEIWRLSRLDLSMRKATHWCEAQIDNYAEDYDGSMWFVYADDSILAIDALSERFEALWRIPELKGPVDSIVRSTTACHFLVHEEHTQKWSLRLPELTLRAREDIESSTDPYDLGAAVIGLNGQGTLLRSMAYQSEDDVILNLRGDGIYVNSKPLSFEYPWRMGGPIRLDTSWLVFPVVMEGDLIIHLYTTQRLELRARLCLEGVTQCALHLKAGRLGIGADNGRVIELDLQNLRVARELKL